MKNFKGMFFSDLKKAFLSPSMYVVILLLTAVFMADMLPLCKDVTLSICDVMKSKAMGAGSLCLLGFCISVMPFTLQYIKETENNCIYNYINRGDVFRYSISKIAAVCLTTFIAVIISNIICLLIFLLMGMPVSDEVFELNNSENHSLIAVGKYITFIAFIFMTEALRSVFFAIVSLCMSAFIKNKFLIVALPVAFYFGVGKFLFFSLHVPDWLNISVIYLPMTIYAPDDLMSFFITAAVTLLMIFIFGAVFTIKVRRCAENGKF